MKITLTTFQKSILSAAVLGIAPMSAYCQADQGPTPNPNGKDNADVTTTPPSTATTTATGRGEAKSMDEEKVVTPGTAEKADKTDKADMSDKSGKSSLSTADKKFVMMAGTGGLAEVNVSKLADTNASSTEVKEFANMMIADHSKVNVELGKLAESKGVTLPTEMKGKHQDKYEALKKLKGADFDKTYVKEMLAGHEKTIAMFETESQKGDDADLKAFATKTLPTLKTHLEHIKKLAGK